MDVTKFIRILGYGVYVLLWLPVILITLVLAPVALLVTKLIIRLPFKVVYEMYLVGLKMGLKHDKNFIETGEW
jgi:hypothetical protein